MEADQHHPLISSQNRIITIRNFSLGYFIIAANTDIMDVKFFIPVLFLFLTACQPKTADKTVEVKTIPSQEYLTAATLFTQHAAEYDALCYQAYHLASIQLIQALEANPEKPAVVLDLDETVLDNSPYTAWQIVNEKPYSPETWAQWVQLAEAKPIAGVTSFLRLADSLGVSIFYVSNRNQEADLVATQKNMQDLGLPQLGDEHFYLKTTTSDKTERRKAVTDLGYDIQLFIGDNLGDYDHIWDKPTVNADRKKLVEERATEMGTKYIALPNTLYGTWEGAVYQYNRSLSEMQKDSARKAALTVPSMPFH